MLLDLTLTTIALSVIIGLRYLAVAGTAYWLFWGSPGHRSRSRQLSRRPPQRKTVRHEVIASLAASPIYALPAAMVLEGWKHGYTKLYTDPAAYSLWWFPASFLIYILAQDAFYYWLHRALHHRRFFALAHRGHHLSHEPSPFASFSFDPAEAAVTAWFLPALTLIVPIHVGVALGVLMLMTLTAVLNHAGCEVWPERWLQTRLGRLFITASHHHTHHTHLGSNFGLFFQYWDRALGTNRVGTARSGVRLDIPA